MKSSENADIGRPLERDDYLDLWKYFESRADQLKEDMFKTLTWVIGFAAAVLGFIVNEFVDLDPAKPLINHKGLAAIFCLVGLALCIYAAFLLSEFAEHIKRNWERAKRCKGEVKGLSYIIEGTSFDSNAPNKPGETSLGAAVEEDEGCIEGTSSGSKKPTDKWWRTIWGRIGGVVILFGLAFVSGLVFIAAS